MYALFCSTFTPFCLPLKVLTSLDEAYVAAGLKEGKAWAKYSFKGKSPKELSLRRVSATHCLSPSQNATSVRLTAGCAAQDRMFQTLHFCLRQADVARPS